MAAVDERASFTCPFCGSTSWNPHDAAEQYCGRCHVFVGDLEQLERVPTLIELAASGLARVLEVDAAGKPTRFWVSDRGHQVLGEAMRRNGARAALVDERRPAPTGRELPPPAADRES